MQFLPAFRSLLDSAGLSAIPLLPGSNGLPAPLGTTTIPGVDGSSVTLPLNGWTATGSFANGTLTGTIPLSGGLQLGNGTISASLTNPELTLGTGTEGSSLSFSLNGGPELKLFDIDTSQLQQAALPNGQLDLTGLLASLSSEGAASLNTVLGQNVFTTGQPVGGITLIVPTRRRVSSERVTAETPDRDRPGKPAPPSRAVRLRATIPVVGLRDPYDTAAYDAVLARVTIGSPTPLSAPIKICDYDPDWPRRYEQEAARMTAALGDRVRRLEHVGSTSVPGLPAKPIVDIVLEVPDSADERSYVPAISRPSATSCGSGNPSGSSTACSRAPVARSTSTCSPPAVPRPTG